MFGMGQGGMDPMGLLGMASRMSPQQAPGGNFDPSNLGPLLGIISQMGGGASAHPVGAVDSPISTQPLPQFGQPQGQQLPGFSGPHGAVDSPISSQPLPQFGQPQQPRGAVDSPISTQPLPQFGQPQHPIGAVDSPISTQPLPQFGQPQNGGGQQPGGMPGGLMGMLGPILAMLGRQGGGGGLGSMFSGGQGGMGGLMGGGGIGGMLSSLFGGGGGGGMFGGQQRHVNGMNTSNQTPGAMPGGGGVQQPMAQNNMGPWSQHLFGGLGGNQRFYGPHNNVPQIPPYLYSLMHQMRQTQPQPQRRQEMPVAPQQQEMPQQGPNRFGGFGRPHQPFNRNLE